MNKLTLIVALILTALLAACGGCAMTPAELTRTGAEAAAGSALLMTNTSLDEAVKVKAVADAVDAYLAGPAAADAQLGESLKEQVSRLVMKSAGNDLRMKFVVGMIFNGASNAILKQAGDLTVLSDDQALSKLIELSRAATAGVQSAVAIYLAAYDAAQPSPQPSPATPGIDAGTEGGGA